MDKGHWSYGRSSYALEIKIRQESDKEFLLTARQAMRYWEDKFPYIGPNSSFSNWLKRKKWRRTLIRNRCG